MRCSKLFAWATCWLIGIRMNEAAAGCLGKKLLTETQYARKARAVERGSLKRKQLGHTRILVEDELVSRAGLAIHGIRVTRKLEVAHVLHYNNTRHWQSFSLQFGDKEAAANSLVFQAANSAKHAPWISCGRKRASNENTFVQPTHNVEPAQDDPYAGFGTCLAAGAFIEECVVPARDDSFTGVSLAASTVQLEEESSLAGFGTCPTDDVVLDVRFVPTQDNSYAGV